MMPQLDPSFYVSQIFWLVLCFAILYLTFIKILLPNLEKILQERKDKIDIFVKKNNELENDIDALTIQADIIIKDAYKEMEKYKADFQIELQKILEEKNVEFNLYSIEQKRITNEKIKLNIQNLEKEIQSIVAKSAATIIHKVSSVKPELQNLMLMYQNG